MARFMIAEITLDKLDSAHACDLAAKTFFALGSAKRLTLLKFIRDFGEASVETLCHISGETQPNVSHHLSVLKRAGILQSVRRGRHQIYSVVKEPHNE